MDNRVSFYTLGCRLNQSETASLQNRFETEGYQLVDFKEPADIVVINTCTVTEGGDTDTRRLINKVLRINPNSHIALIGCQAQTQKEELAKLPNVKLIVGTAEKMNLVDILHEIDLGKELHVITPRIPKKRFTIPSTAADRLHTRANLKVQDGCNFFCSYCEIPFARGRARSRVFSDVVRGAKDLVAAGHKEIVITGINVGVFRDKGRGIDDIVNSLEKIKGLHRIRISSIEPTTIPLNLIKRMGKTKLCRHLHIPLQSASNKILRAMNRKYTASEYGNFIVKASREIKNLCIGADVLVGFPGETENDFNKTLSFLEKMPFAYFHVFSYSDRRLNKSRTFKNKVDQKITRKRSETLRKLSAKKRNDFMQSLIGLEQKVLFEQKKGDFWSGLTDNYMRVNIKSLKDLKNQIVKVKLDKIENGCIIGYEIKKAYEKSKI